MNKPFIYILNNSGSELATILLRQPKVSPFHNQIYEVGGVHVREAWSDFTTYCSMALVSA